MLASLMFSDATIGVVCFSVECVVTVTRVLKFSVLRAVATLERWRLDTRRPVR